MINRKWVASALVLGGLVAAPAIADRESGKMGEKSAAESTCAEKMASEAPIFDKSAEVLTKSADVWTAHAQWIGNSAEAKPERDQISKLASSYRDAAQQMRKVSQTLAAGRDVKGGPHDMKSPEVARVATLMKEQAKEQRELATMLQKDAEKTEKAAQQMSGVGGSGAKEQPKKAESEQKSYEPMPNSVPPDQR